MESVGCSVADESLVNEVAADNGRAGKATADDVETAKQQTLAIRFLRGANSQHQAYLRHLRNSFLDGNDIYPTTLHQAYNTLQRREGDGTTSIPSSDGVAFGQVGAESSDRDESTTGTVLTTQGATDHRPRDLSHIQCFNCQEYGHYAVNCPHPRRQTGSQAHIRGETRSPRFTFAQANHNEIPRTWVLLDSQSNVDIFINDDLLSNIRTADTYLDVQCNAGTASTNLIGDVAGYGTVWYYPDGIANILSLSKVKEKYVVKYDSESDNQFIVIKSPDTTFHFKESPSGLYYMDATLPSATLLVNTVTDNKSNYTNDDYRRAKAARELQVKIGRPSTKDYIRIITNHQIPNCPVEPRDIRIAENIFGPDIGALKGKTVRRPPSKVNRTPLIPIPSEILSTYGRVTLCADIMYVNNIPFMVTISRNLKFITAEVIKSKTNTVFGQAIKNVLDVYRAGGFDVDILLMDGEFESARTTFAEHGVRLNTTARDEHVGEVERAIRTLKERTRGTYNTLPFNKIPPRIVIEMIYNEVFWLNSFPSNGGVSKTLSPRTIITGQHIDYNRHCKYDFGEYVQTHEPHDNSMQPRTVGALALGPTGNNQGTYKFFSLSSRTSGAPGSRHQSPNARRCDRSDTFMGKAPERQPRADLLRSPPKRLRAGRRRQRLL